MTTWPNLLGDFISCLPPQGTPGSWHGSGFHGVTQRPDPRNLYLDHVSRGHVLGNAIGSEPDHVPRLQGAVLGDVVDMGRNVEQHVPGVELVDDHSVYADGRPHVLRIETGNDPAPHRLAGVAVLAAQQGRILPLPGALANVIADRPAEHVVQGILSG